MYVCFIYPFTEKFKDRGEIKRSLDGQYFCLELILRKSFSLDGLLLWNILFCSWIRTRKHVEWYWCGLCDHCFGPVFSTRKRIAAGSKSGTTNEDHNTQERTHVLSAEWDKRLQNSFLWDSMVHHLMGHSRLLPPQSLKKFQHARRNHSRSAFIRYATLFGRWK